MSYIVLDLEWNQAPYKVPEGSRKAALPFEIIQIGAVRVSKQGEIGPTFARNIRPVVHKKLHSHVKRMTGLTDGELALCPGFKEVLAEFLQFCGPDPIFVIWGYDDMPVLEKNLAFHGEDPSLVAKWYNLQIPYSVQTGGAVAQVSLEKALEHFGMVPEQAFHNALNDAYYTARVLQRLDMEKGIAQYGTDLYGPGFVAAASTGHYHSESALLESVEAAGLCCPSCGGALHWHTKGAGTPFVPRRAGRSSAIAHCEHCGFFKVDLQLRPLTEGRWCAKRVLCRQTDKEAAAALEAFARAAKRAKEGRRARRKPKADRATPKTAAPLPEAAES